MEKKVESVVKAEKQEIPIVEYDKKYLLVPKILYFTLSLAYYSCYVFKLKFFNDVLGIKDDDSAFIFAATFIVTAVGSIFWNWLSDVTARPKLLVILTSLATGGIFQLFLLMPSVPKSAAEPVQVLIIMIWTFLYSACQPLLDAIIVKYLKDEGIGKELYGRQRLWASIGYIVVTMAVAKAIDGSGKKIEDMTQDEKIKSYEPMFWIVAMTTILYVVLFFFLVVHDDPAKTFKERALEAAARQEQMTDDSKPSTTKKQQIKQLMTNPQYIFLLVVTLLVGYGRQVFSIYRAKFVEASILNTFDGDRKSFVSITVLTGIVFEILVFFYGKFFLKRMGNYWLMVASLITMLIRLWAYVFVPENEHLWVWFLICVELLKGMSFSTLQIAAVQMSADIAGPDLQATAQGIFTAFNNGFAGVLGAVGSGIILKWPGVARAEKTTGPEMGLKATFLFSAILTTVALGIVMMWPVISRLVNRFRR